MSFKGGQLADMKIISLGQFPVHLAPCFSNGQKAVLAAGNRATVFFVNKGGLFNSPIALKVRLFSFMQINCDDTSSLTQGIAAVSPLNTESFPSSLILVTPAGLFVGRLGELNKMHIHTVSENEMSIRRSSLIQEIWRPPLGSTILGVLYTCRPSKHMGCRRSGSNQRGWAD